MSTAGQAVAFELSGLTASTVVFEQLLHSAWVGADAFKWPTEENGSVSTTTSNGTYWSPNEGDTQKRVRLSVAGGGDTVTVNAILAPNGAPVPVSATISGNPTIGGTVAISQTTPGTTNGVVVNAATVGGWTPWTTGATGWPANVTGQTVKASPGQIGYLSIQNNDTISCWAEVYDMAGVPTIGTSSASIKLELLIPASSSGPGGNNLTVSPGIVFASGIGVLVHGGASNDTTAVSANKVSVNIGYK